MTLALSDTHRVRVLLAAVGLVQGFLYYLAYEYWPNTTTTRALVAGALFLVTGIVLTVHLAWTGKDIKRLFWVSAVTPLVFALVAFWTWMQIPAGDFPYRNDGVRMPTAIFGAFLSLLVLLPGIQLFQENGRRSFPYTGLFRRFWDNLFIVSIAAFVMGAFWLVILLWSELFNLIDVTFFDDVFKHAAFVCMGLSTVFGYGVALGREWERVATTLRNILFAILKHLMPLLAGIALLFLLSLPFTGLQPLWDTRHASATLLSLIALTILFFNGAFQDGTADPPYSPWIRHMVEAALVAIPVFAAITFYALYLRIAQYGLTFVRFYGVLFAIGGMLFGLGYAASVFGSRGRWMAAASRVNVGMGILVVACAVLTHTPILDPLRWSAKSQFDRLAERRVDASEFDFGHLRFELGHFGFEKLARLEELTDHPQADVIRERVRATRAAESYAEVKPQPASLLSASDIVPFDTTTGLPDSLVQYVASRLTPHQADRCEENGDCTMFAVNLDTDDEPEYVLLLSGDQDYEIFAFDRDESGQWRQVGRLRPSGTGARLPVRTLLLDTLRQYGAVTEEPRYRDLVIGGLKLRVLR